MAKKSLPGTKIQPGENKKMDMKPGAVKRSETDKMGKAPKGGSGGFKSNAMKGRR